MTSQDQNEPANMETYLESIQHNRVSGGFDVELSPTFGYVSNVAHAESVRKRYEHKTGLGFSTYRQSKHYGKQDIEVDHHKICWEDNSRLRQGHLSFDHIPYIVVGIKMLDCQYGRDRHVARKKRSLNLSGNEDSVGVSKPSSGKKLDCPAQIYLRDILKFPDHSIECNTVWRRKVMSEKLRKSLAAGLKVRGERRIYIKFPEVSDHIGHKVNSDALKIVESSRVEDASVPAGSLGVGQTEGDRIIEMLTEGRSVAFSERATKTVDDGSKVSFNKQRPPTFDKGRTEGTPESSGEIGTQIHSENRLGTFDGGGVEIRNNKKQRDDATEVEVTQMTLDFVEHQHQNIATRQSSDLSRQKAHNQEAADINPTSYQTGQSIAASSEASQIIAEAFQASQSLTDSSQSSQTNLDSNLTRQIIAESFQDNQNFVSSNITSKTITDSNQISQSLTNSSQVSLSNTASYHALQIIADSNMTNPSCPEVNVALKCKNLIGQLSEETCNIQDTSVLEVLYQGLKDVTQAVERAKKERAVIMNSHSCAETITSMADIMQITSQLQTQSDESSDPCTDSVPPDSETPLIQLQKRGSQCCTDSVKAKMTEAQAYESNPCCKSTVTPEPTDNPAISEAIVPVSQAQPQTTSQTCGAHALQAHTQGHFPSISSTLEGNIKPNRILPKETKRNCTCKDKSCVVCSREKRLKMTKVVRDELCSEESVSNKTIRKAQALILDKFPRLQGFEEATLGHHQLFSAVEGEFGQLMNDKKDHWVFVSSISCVPGKIKYYDSSGLGTIPEIIRKQISCIVCSQETQITVEMEPVQLSRNISDCGLMAIAFAVSVLHSEDPAVVSYDIPAMRQHLYRCFQESKLTPFPKISSEVERTVKRVVTVDVFCLCRVPWNTIADESRFKMAQCSVCGEWWHSNCCGIPEPQDRPTWKCPRCEDVHSALAALDSLHSAMCAM